MAFAIRKPRNRLVAFVARLILAAALLVCTTTAFADVWRVTYELVNAEYAIENTPLNLGDGVRQVGPGALTLEFDDANGELAEGPARLVYFAVEQEFESGADGSIVTTDVTAMAAFDASQSFAAGTLSGDTVSFSESFPYRQMGSNLCAGDLCFLAGLEEGVINPVERTDPVTLNDLTFATGGPRVGAGFSMLRVDLGTSTRANNYLSFEGREVRRVRIATAADDPCPVYPTGGAHTGDLDCDQAFGLDDILRMIQLFNAGRFRCAPGEDDAYGLGAGDTLDCTRHDADFAAPAFELSLSELLRALQLFNLGGAVPCAEGEDGFCAPAQ